MVSPIGKKTPACARDIKSRIVRIYTLFRYI